MELEKLSNYVSYKTDRYTIDKLLLSQLIVINFFGFILAFSDPFNESIYKLIIITDISMSIFTIFSFLFVSSNRKYYILSYGICCIFSTSVILLVLYKIFHLVFGIDQIHTIVLESIALLALLIYQVISALSSIKLGKKVYGKYNVIGTSTILLGILGMSFGRFLVNSSNYTVIHLVSSVCFLYLMNYTVLGTLNIYKFYLKQKYEIK